MKELIKLIELINSLKVNNEVTFTYCNITLNISTTNDSLGKSYYLHVDEFPLICGYFYHPKDYLPFVIKHINDYLNYTANLDDPLNE